MNKLAASNDIHNDVFKRKSTLYYIALYLKNPWILDVCQQNEKLQLSYQAIIKKRSKLVNHVNEI